MWKLTLVLLLGVLGGCVSAPMTIEDRMIMQRSSESLMNYGAQMQRAQPRVGQFCVTEYNGHGGWITRCF